MELNYSTLDYLIHSTREQWTASVIAKDYPVILSFDITRLNQPLDTYTVELNVYKRDVHVFTHKRIVHVDYTPRTGDMIREIVDDTCFLLDEKLTNIANEGTLLV